MEEKLKQVFVELFKLNMEDINDETDMKNVRAWDSLKHMILVTNIEKTFDVGKFSMDEIVKMVSFKDIKEILKGKGIEF